VAHFLTPRSGAAQVARTLASPWSRWPPSPAHILLFSGIALFAISAILAADRLDVLTPVTSQLALLGQASAFVFVLQFYVFYVIIPAWVPTHLALAPLVFFCAMVTILMTARMWLHRRAWLARPSWFGDHAVVLPGRRN
jgi:hypothetical protein